MSQSTTNNNVTVGFTCLYMYYTYTIAYHDHISITWVCYKTVKAWLPCVLLDVSVLISGLVTKIAHSVLPHVLFLETSPEFVHLDPCFNYIHVQYLLCLQMYCDVMGMNMMYKGVCVNLYVCVIIALHSLWGHTAILMLVCEFDCWDLLSNNILTIMYTLCTIKHSCVNTHCSKVSLHCRNAVSTY